MTIQRMSLIIIQISLILTTMPIGKAEGLMNALMIGMMIGMIVVIQAAGMMVGGIVITNLGVLMTLTIDCKELGKS